MSLVSEGLEGGEEEDGVHDQGAHVVEQQQQRYGPGEGLQEDMENGILLVSLSNIFLLLPILVFYSSWWKNVHEFCSILFIHLFYYCCSNGAISSSLIHEWMIYLSTSTLRLVFKWFSVRRKK